MTPQEEALHRTLLMVRNLPELAPFREFLKRELHSETDMMVGLSDQVGMWRAQGGARVLSKLIEMIEDSAKVLEKQRPVRALRPGIITSNSP